MSNRNDSGSSIINSFGRFTTSSAAIFSGSIAAVGAFSPQAAVVFPTFLALGAACLGVLKLNNLYLEEKENGTLENKGAVKKFLLTGGHAVCSALGVAGLGAGAFGVASAVADVAQIPNIGTIVLTVAGQFGIGFVAGNAIANSLEGSRILPKSVHDLARFTKDTVLEKVGEIRNNLFGEDKNDLGKSNKI